MNEFTNFANRDVNNLNFVTYKTQKPFLYFPFANVTTTDLTGDSVFAYGGQGHPKRVGFNGDRGGTLKIDTQMQSAKLYSLITGADIQKTAKWLKRVEVVATGSGITLDDTPIDKSVNVYYIDDDCGTPIEVTTSGKTITGDGITADKEFVVYYQTELKNVQNISIKSTTFPKAFTVYGDTWDKTEDDEIIAQKMIAYKVQPQNNFTVTHSNNGDPATISITCDLLSDGKNNMLDLIFEDDNTTTK